MKFEPRLLRTAERDLRRLDAPMMRRIAAATAERSLDEARPHVALSGEFRGMFRLRVGDYRIVYTLDYEQQVMHVHFIRHRREVYR